MDSRIKISGREQEIKENAGSPDQPLQNFGTENNWPLNAKDLINDFGLGWLVVDLDGNIVEINQVCMDTLGISVEQSVSIRIEEFLAPEFMDVVNDRRLRRLQGEDVPTDYECRLVSPQGEELWVRLLLSVAEQNGKPIGTKAIIVNITAQKSAELEAARQKALMLDSAETQKAIMKSLPANILLIDANGDILSVSDSWQQFEAESELTPELNFQVGQNFLEVCTYIKGADHKSAKQISDGLRQVLNLELPNFEVDGECDFNGDIRWLNFVATPFVHGEQSGAMLMFRDVTGQHQEHDALKLAQARLNELVSSVGGILWTADARTLRFSYVSHAAEQILGYPLTMWTRDAEFWANHIHAEDRESAVEFCLDAINRGENHRFRYRMIAADGRTVWIEDQVTVMFKDGEPDSLNGVMLDITSEVEQAETLANLSKTLDLSFSEIFIVDTETLCFKYVNNGASKNLGFSRQQLMNMTPLDLHPELNQNSFIKLIQPLTSGEKNQLIIITRHLRADGSTYPAEVHLYPTTHNSRPSILAVVLDISERRKAEEFHQLLMQNVKNGLLLVDGEGNILMANRYVSEMFGYNEKELEGRAIECLVPEPLRSKHVTQRLEFMNDIRPIHMGTRKHLFGQRKDGSEFPVDIELSPTKIEDDSYLLLSVNDLTERLKIEKEVGDTREKYQRLVEHMHDAVIVHDLHGSVVYCNDRFLEFFGRTRDEMEEFTMADYVGPDYLAPMFEAHQRRVRGEQVPDVQEFEGVRKDGTGLWLQARTTLVIKDEAIFGTQSILLDITAARLNESKLLASQKHVEDLIDNTPGIVWESEPGTLQFSFVSKQAERLLGYPVERWLNEPNFWRNKIHTHDREMVVREYSDESERDESHKVEYRMIAADGSIVWLDDRIKVVYEDGKPVMLRGIMVNISERKNLMQALRDLSQREGSQVENERRRIAQELHDDYSQRLAFVALRLQSLGQQLPPDLDQELASINELWSEAKLLSTDLHNLAYELAPTSLRKLGLQGAISALCDKYYKLHSLPVDFIFKNLPAHLSDHKAIALYRIVQEALHNVRKHSKAGDATVRLEEVGGNLELTISDSGEGFDANTGDFSKNLGIMGMIERAYMVGGTWSINSDPLNGTEIKVVVPLPMSATSPSNQITRNDRKNNAQE